MHAPSSDAGGIRTITLKKAIIGFCLPLGCVISLVLNGVPIVIALLSAICVSSLFSLHLGFKWDDIQASAMKGVMRVFPATFMMILVGIMIAVWIEAGSVPTLLYYGIKMINPTFFLPLTFIVCVLTCLTTGTSWGTAGTVGLALMGVSEGLGIPLPITAGAVISGALVGEKMSPISSTTILTAASTGTNLIDHILSMMNTTLPATVVSLVLFSYLGYIHSATSADIHTIVALTDGLKNNIVISPVLLAPPLFVLIFSALRKPAIPVFVGGIVLGVVCAILVQKSSLTHVLPSGMNGFVSKTGLESVDKLLSRGGALSMSMTVYLCLCAGIISGVLDRQGILSVLMNGILRYATSIGGLVLSTTAACLALMLGGSGQYCTLTLPGVAFRQAFEDRDVHSSVLSRTMEDSGTMVGAVIPWDVASLFYASVLGVSMFEFGPYAFIAWMSPIVSVLCGYLGIGMFRRTQKIRPLTRRAAA
ncbi:Na+/H+ antiporter NhaC [Pseudomonas fluorescens]|uniref:Na+/H+ antiporter NhaC n=1 Tax=Pseudomonas fluorescens TaxID=294 RepID=UPI0012B6F2A8|nr:Na+/H+ antiporter NhaC [Pseudomonas fluorescens]